LLAITRPFKRLLNNAGDTLSVLATISLSRNYGHQSAVSAALDFTNGDATVVMDGDLQDVPEVIPEFVKRFQEGYDMVYAERVRRKEPWLLRLCYFVFYRAMAKLSDVRLPLDSGDFSLMSKRVFDHLRHMPEHHRYLRGMRTWVGFKHLGFPVERAARYTAAVVSSRVTIGLETPVEQYGVARRREQARRYVSRLA
jgi:polyisoprenyl-phosphate glycosyltransferase